jgi:hypothetical protein
MAMIGYALVGVNSGLDLIWGRKDVFSCYDIPSFDSYVPLMNLDSLMHEAQLDLSFLDKLIDTVVWEETKDIEQAKRLAQLILKKNMALDNVYPVQCLSKLKIEEQKFNELTKCLVFLIYLNYVTLTNDIDEIGSAQGF